MIGGGNIFRGAIASEIGMDRASADTMGMLATVINSLALQDALEKLGVSTRVLSAIEMRQVAEPYIRRRATRHLEKGESLSSPAAPAILISPPIRRPACARWKWALRSFSRRPKSTASMMPIRSRSRVRNKFEELSYIEVLNRELKVMDSTAISLCMDNNLPIIVFNLMEKGNIKRVVSGEPIGTLVSGGKR